MREILAKLTARGVEFGRMAPGTVRPENLAYLLTGLTGPALYLAEWLDLGQQEARHKLYGALMLDVMFRPETRAWSKNDGSVEKLVLIAMAEIARTSLCQKCNGHGAGIVESGEIVTCTNCSGTGHKGIDNQDKADMFGVSVQAWQKTWRSRYADVFRVVLLLNQAVDANIKKRLTGFQRDGINGAA